MADGIWQHWNLGKGEGWQMDCGYLAQVTVDQGPAGWQVRVNQRTVAPAYADVEKAKRFAEWYVWNGARQLGQAYRVILARNPKPSSC